MLAPTRALNTEQVHIGGQVTYGRGDLVFVTRDYFPDGNLGEVFHKVRQGYTSCG